jgi:archaetidylinositol phosphate synthase
MVLIVHRDKVEFLLDPAGKALKRVDPNWLTWIAGLLARPQDISSQFRLSPPRKSVIAAALVFANGFFDAIDGKVARITGKMSKYGDFLTMPSTGMPTFSYSSESQ